MVQHSQPGPPCLFELNGVPSPLDIGARGRRLPNVHSLDYAYRARR